MLEITGNFCLKNRDTGSRKNHHFPGIPETGIPVLKPYLQVCDLSARCRRESCCFNLLCHASAKLFCPTLRKLIIVSWVLNINR